MNVWEAIFAAVLSNAAVLAVLGLLAKALLDKLIARDSKRFEIELAGKANEAIEKIKSELQVQASQTVEKFKSDLQLQAMEHQVRFSRLQKATRKRFPKAIGAIAPVIANPEGRT